MARQKPVGRGIVDSLLDLAGEHNCCCLEMGKLFNQIQKRFQEAGEKGLTDSDLEQETKSLTALTSQESSICYRMGLKYNELRGLLGPQDAQVLLDKRPLLSNGEIVLYGKVAENFTEAQTVAYGIHKLVSLVEYAELNHMTVRGLDPGTSEVSLLHSDGKWKKCKFRDCSADELGQTVIAIKAQRGIPIEDTFDSFDLD